MKAPALIAGLMLATIAAPARAELPAYLLDKDYQTCLAGDSNNQARIAYCDCIREGMRSWDIPTYLRAATQMAAAAAQGPGSSPVGLTEQLAQECIAKVLH